MKCLVHLLIGRIKQRRSKWDLNMLELDYFSALVGVGGTLLLVSHIWGVRLVSQTDPSLATICFIIGPLLTIVMIFYLRRLWAPLFVQIISIICLYISLKISPYAVLLQ